MNVSEMKRVRGADGFTESMFTVLKLDDFVPKDHPLHPIRTWLNDALKRMDDVFARMHAPYGFESRPGFLSVGCELDRARHPSIRTCPFGKRVEGACVGPCASPESSDHMAGHRLTYQAPASA
ncbi:hypothetical protein OKW29_003889 [Paraburkholderia sp. CI3]